MIKARHVIIGMNHKVGGGRLGLGGIDGGGRGGTGVLHRQMRLNMSIDPSQVHPPGGVSE
jgi:hypothetical protein